MEDIETQYVLAVLLSGGLVGLIIGNYKHRIAAGVLWGLILGPIGWLLVALGPDPSKRHAACPYCMGALPTSQVECAHCGHRVVWVRGIPRKPSGPARPIGN